MASDHHGRLYRLVLLLLSWIVGIPSVHAGQDGIVFGVFPYLSPREMVEQFNPLRDYLSRELGEPVTLRSAPDYKAFAERMGQGEYGLVFAAPQLARLAETRDGYKPVAQTGSKIRIIAVARKDSAIGKLADLKGRAISIGARMSITHQVIQRELLKAGLVLDQDVQYLDTAYFSNVLQSVIRGYADAGATGTMLWDSAPAQEREALKVIFRQRDEIPGFILAVHPGLGETKRGKIQWALHRFKDSPEGTQFFRKNHQVDFRPVDEVTMKSLDPYTEMLLRQ